MSDNDFDQMCDQNERDFKNSTELDQLRAENARLREQVARLEKERKEFVAEATRLRDGNLDLAIGLRDARDNAKTYHDWTQALADITTLRARLAEANTTMTEAARKIRDLEARAQGAEEKRDHNERCVNDFKARLAAAQERIGKLRTTLASALMHAPFDSDDRRRYCEVLALAAPAESGPNTEEQR